MIIREWDTPYVHFELHDNVVILTFKPDLVVVKSIAEEIINNRILFIQGVSYPTLADVRKVRSADKAARESFGSLKAQEGVKAGALVSESVFSTFLGNFFLKIEFLNKSKLPTRLFTDKEKAITWLKRYN